MASLTADLKRGDETEVLKRLQLRGIELADYVAIRHDSVLEKAVVTAILKRRMFTPTTEQVQKFLKINEAAWKNLAITEQAIAALGDPPDCPPSDEQHLFCVCLFNETGDAVKTLKFNWQACVQVHAPKGVPRISNWDGKWDGLVFTHRGVRQRAGAKQRPFGLRWQVCELGRQYRKQNVSEVRIQLDQSQIMGMGQELPLVAALHPRWAEFMDGQSIPFVYAPDLEVAPRGRGKFSCTPFLDLRRSSILNNQCLNLAANERHSPSDLYGFSFFL